MTKHTPPCLFVYHPCRRLMTSLTELCPPALLQALTLLGVRHVLEVDSFKDEHGHVLFEPQALVQAIAAILKLHGAERGG